jgi:twitching motility two-component system response regulator PilH
LRRPPNGGLSIFRDIPTPTSPGPNHGSILPHHGVFALADVILVIEDDPDQRKFIERTLLSSGYRVVTAADGQAGLDMAGVTRPMLIILDVMMPRLNGYQTCRALKQSPETAPIPILMLTTKQEPADEFWASQVGADAFLTKPVDITDLLVTVKRLTGSA